MISYHKSDGFFWIRIFGHGIHVKNVKKHRLTFSQRNNIDKYLKIGNYLISYLKP